ncbi:MAG TPA: elongation factor 1-beta [archaeon]|nr:elongation factor 1-beta [archaeon]
MGEVIVSFRVMPKDISVDIDALAKKIKEAIQPEKMDKQPVAFGIVALYVIKIVPDAEGVLQQAEDKLRAIPEVGEVEVTGITRSI